MACAIWNPTFALHARLTHFFKKITKLITIMKAINVTSSDGDSSREFWKLCGKTSSTVKQ